MVGKDLVLTNWHVAADGDGKCKSNLHCQFDYMRLADRVGLGKSVAVEKEGCLAFSHFAGDVSANPSDLLDFVLLKLAQPVGLDKVDKQQRGWVAVPSKATQPTKDEPLIIVQHPLGQPMKIALDTSSVIGLNRTGNRLQYKTNTEPGSSGSPCSRSTGSWWRYMARRQPTKPATRSTKARLSILWLPASGNNVPRFSCSGVPT